MNSWRASKLTGCPPLVLQHKFADDFCYAVVVVVIFGNVGAMSLDVVVGVCHDSADGCGVNHGKIVEENKKKNLHEEKGKLLFGRAHLCHMQENDKQKQNGEKNGSHIYLCDHEGTSLGNCFR